MKSAFNFIHRPRNKIEIIFFFFIIITLYLTINIRPVCNDKTVLRKSKINLSFPASDYKSSKEGIEKDDELFLNPKSSQNQKITLDPSIVKNYSLVVESDGKKHNSVGAERNVIVDDPVIGRIINLLEIAIRVV